MDSILMDLNKRRAKDKNEFKASVDIEGIENIIPEDTSDDIPLEKEKYEFTEEKIEEIETPDEPKEPEIEIEPEEPEEVDEPAPIVAPDSSKEPEAEIEIEEPQPIESPVIESAEIMMETPLLVKIIECARSEISTDLGAQQLVDKIEELVKSRGNLTLSDYEEIFESVDEPEEKEKIEEVKETVADDKPTFKEGVTATNPTTGEKVIFSNGKWQPHND